MIETADILAALYAFAAGLLPGLPLAWGVARRAGWNLVVVPPLALASTLTFVGVAAFGGRYLEYGLGTASVITLALAAVAGAAGVWWGIGARPHVEATAAAEAPAPDEPPQIIGPPTTRTRKPLGLGASWQGLLLGLIASGIALYQRPWFAFTTDTFYHLAAARSLIATGSTLVTDPMHGTAVETLDATSGIFHSWFAMMGQFAPVTLETLFVGITALGAATVVWAMWALSERASGTAWAASIATLGFAGLTLYSDFRMFGFPNRIAVGLILIAILALIDTAEDDYWPPVVALGISGLAALATHLASVTLLAAVTVSLALWWALWGLARRRRAHWIPFFRLALPIGILGVAALPVLASKVGSVTSSSIIGSEIPLKAREEALWFITDRLLVVVPGQFVSAGAVAFFAMAIVSMIAAWGALRHRRKEDLPIAAITSIPLLTLFNPLVASVGVAIAYYAFARTALLMNFIPWVAFAWIAAEAVRSRGIRRTVAAVLAASIIASAVVAQWTPTYVTWVRVEDSMRFGESYTVAESRDADVRNGWGGALWDVKVAVGDTYPVVAADPETGYYLAGLAPVAVVAAPISHSPLAIELMSGQTRRDAMAELTSPIATVQQRRAILERWEAEYVALSPGIGFDAPAYESMLGQPELFEPVVETRRLVLLRVLPE